MVKVKEFLAANGDKYIRYEDYTTQEIINMFASPQTKSFLTDLKTAMASPLFEAYKVEDGKYYLRPTTSACSMFISLDCSDEDYYKGFLTWFMDF
ncbi:MAG: hypothetical protein LBF15_05850 [Candidatus Peribacteria bacterium]|nr:hypothetical protein [Candidatus Peribacteria bacterium]